MSKLSFEKYLSSKVPINVALSLLGLHKAGAPSVTRCKCMQMLLGVGGALSWMQYTPRHQILSTEKDFLPWRSNQGRQGEAAKTDSK